MKNIPNFYMRILKYPFALQLLIILHQLNWVVENVQFLSLI